MKVPGHRLRLCWLIVGASCLMIIPGCSGSAEVEEPPPIMEDFADAMFPIMLHDQVIRHGGHAWRLRFDDITEVELHERGEAAADGTRVAIVSFTMDSIGRRVKARVTYKAIEGEANEGEYGVATFPVSKIVVLSVGGG